MQVKLEQLERDMERFAQLQTDCHTALVGIGERLVRIETKIEMKSNGNGKSAWWNDPKILLIILGFAGIGTTGGYFASGSEPAPPPKTDVIKQVIEELKHHGVIKTN